MYAPYGVKRYGDKLLPLTKNGTTGITPPEAEKTINDISSRCLGCPYPRHGLSCFTDLDTCLRTEMAKIYSRSRRLGVIPI